MAHEQFIRRLFELQGTNFTVVDMQHYPEKKRIELKIWHKAEGSIFVAAAVSCTQNITTSERLS